MEFAGVSARYHATAIHTMALSDPGRRARDVYHHVRQSLSAGLRAVRIGAEPSEVEAASLEPLRKEGLEKHSMMLFGNGIGIGYPPIWLETLLVTHRCKRPLEAGMVFVFHSCLELVDEGIGVIQAGTYVLTTSGLRMLAGGGDIELQIVDA
jgi:Xaa-Pro dipeptidase